MATQTLHYHLTKPASADRVAIGDINDNSDTIDGYLFQANERADQLADNYNTSSTYDTGDYVRRDNYIYKCNTDDTTGTWDDTKWDRIKITEELGNGGGGGSSTFAGLNDVNVQGVQNGDIARYNSTTRKWIKSSDLTDLELSVSQLSSSVLSIAGDVDALELTVSQMSASTLSYDANISTKQKIDNVESSIPTSASVLPYASGVSTKQAIDSLVDGNIITIPTGSATISVTNSEVQIGTNQTINLKKGTYIIIGSLSANWTYAYGQFASYVDVDGTSVQVCSIANPQYTAPCILMGSITIQSDGQHTAKLKARTTNANKTVSVEAYQDIKIAFLKVA